MEGEDVIHVITSTKTKSMEKEKKGRVAEVRPVLRWTVATAACLGRIFYSCIIMFSCILCTVFFSSVMYNFFFINLVICFCMGLIGRE